MMNKYKDIINLSRPLSNKPKMSLNDRSAQFAPFAALIGFDDTIDETNRLTTPKHSLTEDEKNILDAKMRILIANIHVLPTVDITYFIKDKYKSGGAYITARGVINKIDTFKRIICLYDQTKIPFDDLIDISSPFLDQIIEQK